jgi:hypothetical protein
MRFATRVLPGALILLLGFGCLNYTKAFGVEHHYEWAEASGFPAPSGTIYFLGVGLTALGGILVGAGLTRGPSGRR